jgi:methionyl-tRNA formyltransferase
MPFDAFRKYIGYRAKPGVTPKIRMIFMGTPEFGETMLRALLEKEYNVVAVFAQPDRPAGRRRELSVPPVKTLALSEKIPVEQPERLDAAAIARVKEFKPDLIVVAAYGKVLPKEILDIPGFGCVNVHASLLPRWRGASPVQNALMAGDTETGVSVMLMDEGLDTGAIISQQALRIDQNDTAGTLLEKLGDLGAALLVETLPLWIRKKIEPKEQDSSASTACQLIEREDGRVFWSEAAESVWNRYRGLSPWPGIFTFWKRSNGEFVRIKLSRISVQKTDPETERKLGEVFETGEHIAIRTGKGVILLEELQPSGKEPMSARDFMNGHPDFLGSVLE